MFRSIFERFISLFYSRSWDAAPNDAGEWVWKRYNPVTREWETRPMSPEEAADAGMLWAIR